MTYNEKLCWLRRYRQALREEERLKNRILAVRSRAESTTRALQPVSVIGGNGGGCRIERCTDLLDQYQRDLERQLRKSERLRAEIEEAINALPSALQRNVLQARYIDGLPVWRTANMLYISESWVKQAHKKAVENLQVVSASVP